MKNTDVLCPSFFLIVSCLERNKGLTRKELISLAIEKNVLSAEKIKNAGQNFYKLSTLFEIDRPLVKGGKGAKFYLSKEGERRVNLSKEFYRNLAKV